MSDKPVANESNPVAEELVKEDPAETVAPPQIKLQQEPIPNPNLDNSSK